VQPDKVLARFLGTDSKVKLGKVFPRFIRYIKDCEVQQETKICSGGAEAAKDVAVKDAAEAGLKKAAATQIKSVKAGDEASPKKRLDFEEGAAGKASSKEKTAKRRQAEEQEASPKKKKPVFDFTKKKVDDSDDEDETPLLVPSLKTPPRKTDSPAPVSSDDVAPAPKAGDLAPAPDTEGKNTTVSISDDTTYSPSPDSDEAQNLEKSVEDSIKSGQGSSDAATKGDDALVEEGGDAVRVTEEHVTEDGVKGEGHDSEMEVEGRAENNHVGGTVDDEEKSETPRSDVESDAKIAGVGSECDSEMAEAGEGSEMAEAGEGGGVGKGHDMEEDGSGVAVPAIDAPTGSDPHDLAAVNAASTAKADPKEDSKSDSKQDSKSDSKEDVKADSKEDSREDSKSGLKRLRPATTEGEESNSSGKPKKKAKKELAGFSPIPLESLSDPRIKTCKRLVKVISDVDLIEQHVIKPQRHEMEHPAANECIRIHLT
jgi:hypothetical protein